MVSSFGPQPVNGWTGLIYQQSKFNLTLSINVLTSYRLTRIDSSDHELDILLVYSMIEFTIFQKIGSCFDQKKKKKIGSCIPILGNASPLLSLLCPSHSKPSKGMPGIIHELIGWSQGKKKLLLEAEKAYALAMLAANLDLQCFLQEVLKSWYPFFQCVKGLFFQGSHVGESTILQPA